MIFRKSLIHEMTVFAAGLFVVLMLIVMTSQIVRLLGEAAIGALASGAVWTVMGFAAVRYLPVLFSLMLFISILATLTRMWRDSEMVVWFASGQSIYDFLGPVLRFAVPLALITAVLSLGVSPWAMQKSREYRDQMLSRQETTQIAPGVFRENKGADRVYFVENFSGDAQQGSNVFVQMKRDQKIAIITAKRGKMETDENGDRWIALEHGRTVEGTPGSAAYDVMSFESGKVRIDAPQNKAVSQATKAMSSWDLWLSANPEHQAELVWRVALPICALILSVLAVPLAFANPRGGRTFHILFALLLAFFYYNCINIGQAWIAQGKIPVSINIWPLHAVFALLAYVLLRHRSRMGVGK